MIRLWAIFTLSLDFSECNFAVCRGCNQIKHKQKTMKKILLSMFVLFALSISAQTGNILSNSSFEEWSDDSVNDWATLSKVSNGAYEKSDDAHSGNFSVVVNGASSNKRFASKSYSIEPGTYTISAYVKANGDDAGHYRIGYVKLKDGVVVDSQKDYIYDDTPARAVSDKWTEETFTFTVDAVTELAINIMNNKNGGGKSFLVDDVTLTMESSDGGDEGEPETPAEVSTIADVLAAGAGEASVKGTVIATYSRGFLVNDATGTILVYLGSDKGYKEGDVVSVSGSTSVYGGLLQFGNTSVVEVVGTASVSHSAPVTFGGADLDAYLVSPVIKYVEYTGTLTISGNYYNVAVDGASTAVGSIQYPKEGVVNASSGSVVKVTGYTIGVSSSKYVNTMAVKVEVLDEGEPETPAEVSTIADVLAAGAGEASVKGTVIATYSRGFLVNDATGTILVYLGSDKGYKEGDVVSVSGSTSVYGGLLQFGNTSVVEVVGTASVSHSAPVTFGGADLDAYLVSPVIKYVEYTGTLTISGNYYNVAVDGASTAVGSIQYPKEGVVNASSGSVVKVTGYAIGVSSSKYVNTMAVKVEAVEDEPVEPIVGNVSDALAAYVDGKTIPLTVTGYIVGAVNGDVEKGSEFGTTEVATNILISDNADENDYTKCLIVQLPKGDIRNALNLVDNPANYKKQIKIVGSLETYFKVAGLKNVTEFEFTGVTGIDCVKILEDSSVNTIYDITGRKIESITKSGIYIVNGKKVLVK